MSDLKWRQEKVDPEAVRLELQKVQLYGETLACRSKIVSQILVSAARYAIQKLQSENAALRGQVAGLKARAPRWVPEDDETDEHIHLGFVTNGYALVLPLPYPSPPSTPQPVPALSDKPELPHSPKGEQ